MKSLLIVLLILLAAGCGRSQAQDAKKKGGAVDLKPFAVTVAVVEGRSAQRSVETIGTLTAWEESQVKVEVSGSVLKIAADLGDLVRADQLLLVLDTREFRLAVEQAEASLRMARETMARTRAEMEDAKTNLARAQELHRRELISAQELDRARTQHRVAQATAQWSEADIQRMEAALGVSRKKLDDAAVKAPLSGAVAKRHVNVSEFVKEGATLFTLVVSDPLKYTGTVPERFSPEIKPGRTLHLNVDAFPGRSFAGRVTRVAPAVDAQTRTLTFEARVPNADGALTPGFFAKGAVLTRKEDGVAFVPADAVTYFVGISKVFVVADGKVEERQVKTGAREAGWVEILEGVKTGEKVVIGNLSQLFTGAPVTIVPGRTEKK